MQRLRQKKINDFINTLNEREKRYILKKIKNELEDVDVFKLDFTINGKKRYIA